MIQLRVAVFITMLILLSGMTVRGQEVEFRFSEPELLKTNDGKVIEIESGSCAPFLRDMNGDGRVDLLVGEFGNVTYPGYEKVVKRYVQGRCRVYYDVNQNGKPALLPFSWLESEGVPLYVPITCCVCMSPAFLDMNGDGVDDLISGSYPGELYWWPALPDGSWGERQEVEDEQGNVINIGNATTVFVADMDGDGVRDLLVNSLYDGIFWIKNKSVKNERVRWASPSERVKISLDEGGLDSSYAIMEDIDGDGCEDLLYGNRECGIYWCRGTNAGFEKARLLLACGDYRSVVLVGDSLKGPGKAPRFCVYDWDGDGKKDIIVCTETGVQQQRHFSKEELEKKNKLKKEYNYWCEKWSKLQNKAVKSADVEPFYIGRVPYESLPQRLADKLRPVDEECSRLLGELRPYEEFYFRNTGYIWVYYRQ